MRLHTEFSIVDSTCRIDDVVQAAADDQQPALAITDLSNLFGAIKFYKAARGKGWLLYTFYAAQDTTRIELVGESCTKQKNISV